MTGDEFSNRFRLVEKLTDTGVTTYRGVDSRRGGVLVHLMPGPETATPETLAERGVTLAAIDELAYHECLDVEGMRVVVTTDLDDFTTYESWIEEVEQRARAFGGAVAEPETSETGEEPAAQTTSAWKEEATGAAEPTVDGEGAGEAVDETASQTVGEGAEDAEAPGEFTRLFEASDVADADPAASEPVDDAAPPPTPEVATPGDAAPPPPPEPAPSDESRPPELSEPEPSEGTRPDGEAATAEEAGSADQAPGGPGEYTRIMMQLEGIEVPRTPGEGGDASDEPASSEPPTPSSPPRSSPPRSSPPETPPPETPAPPEPPAPPGPPAPPEPPPETSSEAPPSPEGPGPYTRLMRRSAGGDGEESPSQDRRGLPYRTGSSGGARERGSGASASPEPDETDGYLDRLREGVAGRTRLRRPTRRSRPTTAPDRAPPPHPGRRHRLRRPRDRASTRGSSAETGADGRHGARSRRPARERLRCPSAPPLRTAPRGSRS